MEMSMDVARRIKETLCYTASDVVKVLSSPVVWGMSPLDLNHVLLFQGEQGSLVQPELCRPVQLPTFQAIFLAAQNFPALLRWIKANSRILSTFKLATGVCKA